MTFKPIEVETDEDIIDVIDYAIGWLRNARSEVGVEGCVVLENLINAQSRIQQLIDWYREDQQ